MFEGKLPPTHDSRDSAAGRLVDEDLCEMSWGDLVARLSAARELRAELAESDEATLASFDAESARHIASQHETSRRTHDEPDVNHDGLGNGKRRAAERNSRADRETPATRGNT
ncbi:hypothetical protein [Aurantiacibacter hainanensis]|uniref:hypothetical protein n=1 Tax=Aurantiacibacter hainanensis TaxID=3076114 RepID=UPI0030C777E5